jgi:methyl-accepting chemotaxis protein
MASGFRKLFTLSIVISVLAIILGVTSMLAQQNPDLSQLSAAHGDSQNWILNITSHYGVVLLTFLVGCCVWSTVTCRSISKKLVFFTECLDKSTPIPISSLQIADQDIIVRLEAGILASTDRHGVLGAERSALEAERDTLLSELHEAKKQLDFVRERTEKSRRDGLMSAARTLGVSIEGIHDASSNLLSLSRSAGKGAQQQQDFVRDVSALISDLNTATGHMSERSDEAVQQAQMAQDKARDGSTVVEKTVESIRMVERKAEDLAAVVRDLGNQAKAVEKIMEVISDIADQTNLLALNAAIEAARAGDAGRGFAVVADEVRKLAEKTMNATRDVADRIEGIQKGVDRTERDMEETASRVEQAVDLAQSSGASLQEIVSLAGETVRHIDDLADAARQQSETSAHVGSIIQKVSAISQSSFEGAQNATDAVAGLLDRVVGLESMNAVFRLVGDGGLHSTIETLAGSPAFATLERGPIEEAMAQALRQNASFELLYATDAQGRQLVSNMGLVNGALQKDQSAIGKNWQSRPWFLQPMELGSTVVSEVYVSSATGENCLTVSTPIRNAQGDLLGVLAADINLGKATAGQSTTC